MYIYDISFSSSQNEKCFRQKLYRKSKYTFNIQELRDKVEKYITGRQATDTHSEYVTLTDFPWQQWLCEHA